MAVIIMNWQERSKVLSQALILKFECIYISKIYCFL